MSNQTDIQELLPTHELIVLTKFGKDGTKFVDFLLKANFLSWELFYKMPSTFQTHGKTDGRRNRNSCIDYYFERRPTQIFMIK